MKSALMEFLRWDPILAAVTTHTAVPEYGKYLGQYVVDLNLQMRFDKIKKKKLQKQ